MAALALAVPAIISSVGGAAAAAGTAAAGAAGIGGAAAAAGTAAGAAGVGGAAAAAGAAAAGAAGAAGASGLSLGATALAAGGGLVGALAENRAQQFNAKVADQQAAQAAELAAVKASEIERRGRQTMAQGRAAAAQSGFETTGSVGDVLDQQQRQIDLDILSAVYDGRVQAMSARSDAKLARSRGRAAVGAGVIGAGATALNGMSSFYNQRTRKAAI